MEYLKILYLINSQELCELAATKFVAGIVEIFGENISDAVNRLEKLRNNEVNNFYSSSNIIGVLSQLL
jgi:hypothetical protein